MHEQLSTALWTTAGCMSSEHKRITAIGPTQKSASSLHVRRNRYARGLASVSCDLARDGLHLMRPNKALFLQALHRLHSGHMLLMVMLTERGASKESCGFVIRKCCSTGVREHCAVHAQC